MDREGNSVRRVLSMLDFSFIADEKSLHTRGLAHAGGSEYEEFAKAQELKVIDSHFNYYGKFR